MKIQLSYSIKYIFLSGFLFAACGKKQPLPKTGNQVAIVDVIIAQPSSINNLIEVTGSVISNEYVQLQPETSGRITYLNVPEGKYIAQGTLIARINDADLEAQLAKSKVELDLAQKTVDRYKQLLAVNGINQSDYDAALNTAQGYAADIQYEQALIDKTFLKAPFSGVVGLRQVSLGANVSSASVIATLQELSNLKIDFTIPEIYAPAIKKGSSVDVEFDNAAGQKMKATIIATEPEVDANTRNLKVRAILQKASVNPGAFAKVYVDAGAYAKAIMVPTNALIPEDKSNQLVLVKKGKAIFTDIQTGVRQDNNVQITSGVSEGDTVIVTGVLFAKAKAPVKIRSVKTLAQLGDSTITQNQ
jgi:membrane fusion protein (multidrug efflux system)